MSGTKKSTTTLVAVSLTIMIVVSGCRIGEAVGLKAQKVPTAEEKKAQIVRQLDRKFENPDAHCELGQLYHQQGLYDQAGYHYNVALRFDPAHRGAQAGLVKLLIDRKKTAESRAKATEFMGQVVESAGESVKLARALDAQGVDDYALASYQQALRLQPESAEIFRDLGYYHLKRKQNDIAKQYFTRSFQLNANQPDVAGELGRMGVEVRIPQPAEKKSGWWDRIRKRLAEPKKQ